MIDQDTLLRLRQELAAAADQADARLILDSARALLAALPEPARERVLEELADLIAEKPG